MKDISAMEDIKKDIVLIRKSLGQTVKRVALFGSALASDYNKANDVDLALFVDGLSLYKAKRKILRARLSLPVRCRAVNGGYGLAPSKKNSKKKDYHIILLTAERPNPRFIRLNRGSLVTLWKEEK